MELYGDFLGLPRSSVWQRPGHDPVGAEFETVLAGEFPASS
jgi:hypothetical protein